MKKMIKLTAIPHPDINRGKPYSIFVDVEPIMLIERTAHQQTRSDLKMRHNIAVSELWDELQRAMREVQKAPNVVPENEEEVVATTKWVQRTHLINSMSGVYQQLNSLNQQPSFYDPVECTVIQMGAQNSRYTMLPCVYVVETPEEVMRSILEATQ